MVIKSAVKLKERIEVMLLSKLCMRQAAAAKMGAARLSSSTPSWVAEYGSMQLFSVVAQLVTRLWALIYSQLNRACNC